MGVQPTCIAIRNGSKGDGCVEREGFGNGGVERERAGGTGTEFLQWPHLNSSSRTGCLLAFGDGLACKGWPRVVNVIACLLRFRCSSGCGTIGRVDMLRYGVQWGGGSCSQWVEYFFVYACMERLPS